ncbi:MAG TPA: SgcJ/EcaC family oxidoreductase [Candidatus Acidoferrales bacterium]|nr:SgcJ/EcaC family oxidoreductase [Candidatus Acidoferrales bacterium]
MRRPLGSLAALILMSFFFAAPIFAAANNAQEVRNAVMGFATDWNHHDMAAFGKLFAPDADFVTVTGFRMKGRQQIQMDHAWMHGVIPRNTPGFPKSDPHYGIFAHSTMKFIHIDVRFLRKDVAVAHVNWELLGDSRTPKRHGVLLFVLTRQNGGWLIAVAQNTEINRTVK